MSGEAVGYLRKSKSDDPTKEVTEVGQRRDIEEMARRDGLSVTTWYRDWDRTADEAKAARRTEFARMLRAIESGSVSVVYASAADRLYRGLESYVRLTTAAEAHGVRIVTHREGSILGDGSPLAEMSAGLGALLGRFELATAKVRAKNAAKVRRLRGDYMGQVPYGWRIVKDETGVNRLERDPSRPVEPIIEAYRRARGRTRAAVRILNDELRIPSAYGGTWDRPSLLRLIGREAPDLLPPKTTNGRREAVATPAVLAKLLRCHCGRLLTPNFHREHRRASVTRQMNYYCARGNSERSTHARVYVSEAKLMPWIMAEADRYALPTDPVDVSRDTSGERAALEAERTHVTRLGLVPGADLAVVQARLDEITKAIENVEAESVIEEVGPIDWEHTPVAELNAVLRAYWYHVQLDEYLRPVSADWRIARMRPA